MAYGVETRITASTETLGVVGHPVRHSLSPILQNALLDLLGIDACYHAFEVPPRSLSQAIRGAAALGFRGLNVTVPHKPSAAELCDYLTEESRTLGVANTLLFRQGKIHGHTTDPMGFLYPLRARGFALQGKNVILIGAGGAARAVAYACAREGAATIRVLNRTPEKAADLIRSIGPLFADCHLTAASLSHDELRSACEDVDLMVNATSVGMWPHVDNSPLPEDVELPQGILAYDLVYNPLRTRFLRQAEARGLATQDGLDMLIYQAIASLEFWFEKQIQDWEELAKRVRPVLERALSQELRSLEKGVAKNGADLP